METLIQDLRFSIRMLLKNPSFTIVAVFTLALGIGANTAIFSVINTVLLKPLPYKDSDHLLVLTEYNSAQKVLRSGLPFPDYQDVAKQSRVFEETAAYYNVKAWDGAVLSGTGGSAEMVKTTIVTNSFFSILGVHPALGRDFTADEERAGGGNVFLISDGLWQRSFGGNPNVVGKTFQLDGDTYTLIGVMPRGFQFPEKCDLWASLSSLSAGSLSNRSSHPFWMLARLRPGVTQKQAQAELDGVSTQLEKIYPKTNSNWRVKVNPLIDEYVGNLGLSLMVIFGVVVFVLLLACANVTNLLLARAVGREKEFAIRTAMGAGKKRLLRQTLTESLVIVSLSTVLALLLAKGGIKLLTVLSADSIQRMDAFRLDPVVLFFAGLLTVITTVLVGLAPAWQGSALNFQQALREGSRSGMTGVHNRRLRNGLVVSEVAITLLLLCGAGLMLKSFARLQRVNPGFLPEHVVTMKIALPQAQYPKIEQRTIFMQRLLENIRTVPGTKSVAAVSTLPLGGQKNWALLNIVGRPMLDWSHAPTAELRTITADYFRTMGIPLMKGQEFKADDSQESTQVAIINQALAARFFPGQDPIGQHIIVNSQQQAREIVGVVGNVKHFGLDAEDDPEIYLSYTNQFWPATNLVLRGSGDPTALVSGIRHEVELLDKSVPVYKVATMDQLLANSVAPQRLNLFLLGLFAVLALVLGTIGIYGLLAFGVSRRRHEIGVRMALGALPARILQLIVWQGMRLVLVGVGVGIVGSFVLTRVISSLLYNVSPTDPLTFASVTAILVIVGIFACALPALRAMRVNPTVALRHE
jgi:putative ABC transport system permease protein